MPSLLVHASYIAWAARAVHAANEAWRCRQPYLGETIMDREGLHSHLFRWAVAEGMIPDPDPFRDKPHSVYVARVFRKDPEAVKEEARNYWRILVGQTRGYSTS
jgi:hypothetical protein